VTAIIDGDLDMRSLRLQPRPPTYAALGRPEPALRSTTATAPRVHLRAPLDQLGFVYDEGDANAGFADWDNDGDLDLYVASLYPTHYARLYRNDGAASFVDVTYEAGTLVHLAVGVAFSDVDEDGDLDLLAAEGIGPRRVHLFENQVGQDRAFLQLELRGTTSNRDAVGALVTVQSDGRAMMRAVEAGTAHHLQHSHLMHFGLGDASAIDSVDVRWPSGVVETIDGADIRGRYLVVEGSGVASPL
jgi:hypothetical protein